MIDAEPWTKLECDKLLWMYDRMSLIREFEERLKFLIDSGLPVGSAHYYTGEEAVAAGSPPRLGEHRGNMCFPLGVLGMDTVSPWRTYPGVPFPGSGCFISERRHLG